MCICMLMGWDWSCTCMCVSMHVETKYHPWCSSLLTTYLIGVIGSLSHLRSRCDRLDAQ